MLESILLEETEHLDNIESYLAQIDQMGLGIFLSQHVQCSMFVIKGGLAEKLGFKKFSINIDTVDLYMVSEEEVGIVFINPRLARRI